MAKKCHEEFSYESLETLGDSFLKYAASQHLFAKYEHHHEGILSNKKDMSVSNTHLCYIGCLHNLGVCPHTPPCFFFPYNTRILQNLDLVLFPPSVNFNICLVVTYSIVLFRIKFFITVMYFFCYSEFSDIFYYSEFSCFLLLL